MTTSVDRDPIFVFYVGTRKLVALAGNAAEGPASPAGGEPRILRHAEAENPDGFENGLVTHLEKASHTLEALAASLPLRGPVFIVLGNAKLRTYQFSSSQYFQGLKRTITPYEVRSVVAQTRAVATLPLTEFVLQAFPESFLVDDMADVRNPLGLAAQRLGVQLKIFTMDFQAFRNISRAFEVAEIDVKGYLPKMLTLSEAVLTDEEKDEGALLVDFDEDGTSLTLWKNGFLKNSRVLPVGGKALSAALAGEWQIELRDAEKVKEKYASLASGLEFADELIPLVGRSGKNHYPVHRKTFHEKFLEAAKDWLKQIIEETEAFTREEKMLFPHLIFAGRETSWDGFLEFVEKQFSLHARTAATRKMEAPHELLVDPTLPAALGMYHWLAQCGREQEQLTEPQGLFEKTFASARDWFSAYF